MKKSIFQGTVLSVLALAVFTLSTISCKDNTQTNRVFEPEINRVWKGKTIGAARVFRVVDSPMSIVTVESLHHTGTLQKIDVLIPTIVNEEFLGKEGEEREIYFYTIQVSSWNWYAPGNEMHTPIGIMLDETKARKNIEAGTWILMNPDKKK